MNEALRIIWVFVFVSLGFVFALQVVAAATDWVINPTECLSNDQTNFPGQYCEPDDICGDDSGTVQCFDTSSMTAPSANTTTYSTNNVAGDDDGGFSLNCYATADAAAPFCDNGGAYTCERNETFHGSPAYRDTVCIGTASGGTFGDTSIGVCKTEGTDRFNCYGDLDCESTSTSDCENSNNNHYDTGTCETDTFSTPSATCVCDTNFFACDASETDADGCEIQATASCGSGTGTIVLNECFSASAGNCTSGTNSDCNNDDSDSNIGTCNGADGCEITSGAACLNATATGTGGTYVSNQCSSVDNGGNCTSSSGASNYFDCDDSDSDGNIFTCNVGNGCEVQNGTSCTAGAVPGTVVGCSGGAAQCIVDTQHHLTNQSADGSSANPNLWSTQYGAGVIANFSNGNLNLSLIVNNTACLLFSDGTGGCTLGDFFAPWTNNLTDGFTQDLVPNTDRGFSLGSITKWFKSLFVEEVFAERINTTELNVTTTNQFGNLIIWFD